MRLAHGKEYRCGWGKCLVELLPANLGRHVYSKHTNPNEITCEKCHQHLSRPDALLRHLETCLKCPDCLQEFETQEQKKWHPSECPMREKGKTLTLLA